MFVYGALDVSELLYSHQLRGYFYMTKRMLVLFPPFMEVNVKVSTRGQDHGLSSGHFNISFACPLVNNTGDLIVN